MIADDLWAERLRKHDAAWREMEAEVQSRSLTKDPTFVLCGPWKSFYRHGGRFLIYLVDGSWVRNNLSIVYGHGGHGFVHEFIPLNEIWVSRYHAYCDCKNITEGQLCSRNFLESTALHEITEREEMEKGVPFVEAHQIALRAEEKAGFLTDPYMEV